MDITIEKAVLHILDANASLPVYSQQELPLDVEENISFLSAHIRKLILDSGTKEGKFREGSVVGQQVQMCEQDFLQGSTAIADRLFTLMKQQPDIPSADLLAILAQIDGARCLGLFKLNYHTGYTHAVDYNERGACTHLMVHRVIFASENQKVEEAALVPLPYGAVKILEKPYRIDGQRKNYFSELFLECDTMLSAKESLKALDSAVKEVAEKYCEDPFQRTAAMKNAIYGHLEESSGIDVEVAVQAAFEESGVMRRECLEKVREAGVAANVQMQGESPEKKFSKCKIRAENGIELNIPMELYRDRDVIEFLNQPDGTVAILIKKVGKLRML